MNQVIQKRTGLTEARRPRGMTGFCIQTENIVTGKREENQKRTRLSATAMPERVEWIIPFLISARPSDCHSASTEPFSIRRSPPYLTESFQVDALLRSEPEEHGLQVHLPTAERFAAAYRIFPNERTDPKGGFTGVPFFGSFLIRSIPGAHLSGERKVRLIRLS